MNSQTFENIALRGQAEVGFANEGQAVSIRGFTSDSTVPALASYGTMLRAGARSLVAAPRPKRPRW